MAKKVEEIKNEQAIIEEAKELASEAGENTANDETAEQQEGKGKGLKKKIIIGVVAAGAGLAIAGRLLFGGKADSDDTEESSNEEVKETQE